MKWVVEYTDEFELWWSGLTEDEQVSVAAYAPLLEERGANFGFPHSSGIYSQRHQWLKAQPHARAEDAAPW